MGRTYIGYGYTNSEGVATLDYDANGNQLPKKSYACHSRNTSVVAEASIDNVITASNSIRFCENYVPPSETLSLTVDKNILSYADSDSCTLTATYDGSDVSGKSVVFKAGSTVLATETTDSNGVATYEYESQGIGDVTFTVECMNLQETYEVHDYLKYDSCSSDNTSKYTVPTGNSMTFDSTNNCYILANTSSGVNTIVLNGATFSNQCKVSFDVLFTGGSNVQPRIGLFNSSNGITSRLVGQSSSSSYFGISNQAKTTDGTNIQILSNQSTALNTWYTIELTYTNGSVTAKWLNGTTVIQTLSGSESVLGATGNVLGLCTGFGTNSSFKVKNIIVKPL